MYLEDFRALGASLGAGLRETVHSTICSRSCAGERRCCLQRPVGLRSEMGDNLALS